MHDATGWLIHEREVRDRTIDARELAPRGWRVIERCPEALHQYFLLRHGGRQWLGRKFIAETATGPSLSNRIHATHLLGDEFDIALCGDDVVFDVTLRRRDDAIAFLREAARDPLSDIVFPFPARGADGREWVCPPSFWTHLAAKPARLAHDEWHMRSVC